MDQLKWMGIQRQSANNISVDTYMTGATPDKEIQKQLLVLLKEFDDFCASNNINYSLHGGTLLGAVRNNGFIEWDDDADVSMTRENFNKFLKAIRKTSTPPNFILDLSTSQRPMLWSTDKNINVWLDVFVYDYISKNHLLQRSKLLLSIFFLAFTKTKNTMRVFRSGDHKKGIARIVVEGIYLTGKCFPMSWKVKANNFLSSFLFNGSKSLIYRSNDQYVGLKKIIPAMWMTTYTGHTFEDFKFQVTTNWDEVLRSCYGDDYMIPKKDSDKVVKAHNLYRTFRVENE